MNESAAVAAAVAREVVAVEVAWEDAADGVDIAILLTTPQLYAYHLRRKVRLAPALIAVNR